MTTLIQGGDELREVVTSARQIVAHIERHAKPREAHLIGLEYERLGVFADSGQAIPYDNGVERILDTMAERDGWERGLENGRIIYLTKGVEAITLEPGGQTEFSSAPAKTIGELMENARRAGRALDEAAASIGAVYLGIGYQPFTGKDEINWVPKGRYGAMGPYLAKRGNLGHEMMKMTAGCQVALDYTDGVDAMRKLRAAVLCTPIAQALFASSGIGRGRALDDACWRARIWTDTDDARCNIPAFMTRPGSTVEDYVEWLVDMPLMFVERDHKYFDGTGWTLRRLMREERPTMYDVELVMTQAFPEARLKRFVEIRSLDTPQPWLLGTVPCFWSSLLYGDIDGIFELLGKLSAEDFQTLREAAMRDGMRGTALKRPMTEWASDLLSLTKQSCTCARNMGYLWDRVERRVSPSDWARELLRKVKTPGEFVTSWNYWRKQG